MKYSYSWLKELSGTKLSAEKVAELLTMHSFEVEGLENVGNVNLRSVVVGKILEIEKHPNADKLQITKINVGTNNHLSIICGANNIKVGDKVPVALVGAKLPNGMEIKEVEIRGVKSFGMLCAEDELGFGKDHSGIMILDKDTKVGNNLFSESELNDTIIDLDVLANRGHDALSYIAMAREVCAVEGRNFDAKYYENLKISPKKSKLVAIDIKDKNLCPRYFAAVMENIKVKDSPDWIKAVFRNLGIKSINNIVDATNCVMLETGQPLHAFDLEKISSGKIIVRSARDEEKIKLLDGNIKELNSDDVVIAGENKILALAGVMGGEDSGISENTKTIVVESANFNPKNIRKTRMKLGLQTDASTRFEKGIDPNLAELAIKRVVEIITSMDGKIEGIEDAYPNKIKPWKIKLNVDYARKLLGEDINDKEIAKILNLLGLKNKIKKNIAEVEIPTIRIDLKTQEDLIEEIGRIYGYEKIKPQPIVSEVKPAKMSQKMELRRIMKDVLVGLGFDEVINYSFYSRIDADRCGLGGKEHLELENPQSPEQELLRISLLPNLLKNVRENLKNFENFDIFEMGKVFLKDAKEGRIEKTYLSGVSVFAKKSEKNFFEVKGYFEAFFQKMRMENLEYISDAEGMKIKSNGKEIGFLKIISQNLLESFEIKRFKGDVLAFEFDADLITELSGKDFVYKQISKYPKARRDISFMLEKNKTTVQKISDLILKLGGKNLESAELFDIFQKGTKTSLAYHLAFSAKERTLENKEVDEMMEKIITGLEKELKAEIRK